MMAAGEPFQSAQQLAVLASDLQSGVSSIVLPTQTLPPADLTAAVLPSASATETPGGTLVAVTETLAIDTPATPIDLNTPTPRPTRTPVATASAPFLLISQDRVCNPNLTDGLLQVTVLDNHSHPMPGVDITITWSTGQEHFFTGFKPEISDGYGDYVMQPGLSYSLQVARAGAPVAGLVAPSCTDASNQSYLGGLKLTFRQP